MKISVKLAFEETAAVRLLNWLAQENARIFRSRRDLPLLYDSGVVYRRERDETWCDAVNLLLQGHEDCDGLAAYRAGELMARGYRALAPKAPGEQVARRLRLATIPAEVMLTTRTEVGEPGMYHCIVRYRVAGRWHRDDPSLRLGMRGGRIDPAVKLRWAKRGIRAPQEVS